MIGTIVNTCTIVAGTLVGALLHRGIKEKYKNVLYNGLGLVSLAIGLNATVQNLPKSQYPVLFIVAIALGGIVGTWLDIDGWFRSMVAPPQPSPKGEGGHPAVGADPCVCPLTQMTSGRKRIRIRKQMSLL